MNKFVILNQTPNSDVVFLLNNVPLDTFSFINTLNLYNTHKIHYKIYAQDGSEVDKVHIQFHLSADKVVFDVNVDLKI